MPRKSAAASSVSAAPADTPVSVSVETVVAPAPAAAPKVSRKPKAAKPVVEEPVVQAPVVAAVTPVVEEPVAAPATTSVASLQSRLADFGSKIQEIGTLHSSLKTEYKILEKTIAREMKQIAKSNKNKKRSTDGTQLYGFAKPSLISDELIKFLGKEPGTTMSRVEVAKEMSNYISANNLKDEKNGRIIHADAKLLKLLKITASEDLNYFNLQKYMKHHFIKATPAATSA